MRPVKVALKVERNRDGELEKTEIYLDYPPLQDDDQGGIPERVWSGTGDLKRFYARKVLGILKMVVRFFKFFPLLYLTFMHGYRRWTSDLEIFPTSHSFLFKNRLHAIADKPLSLPSLWSTYPHLESPSKMVPTRTYSSGRADNLPLFGSSAHGCFLLFHQLYF
jgi:hypothetical protein